MSKFYLTFLCICLIGINRSFGQTGCLYNGYIYTGSSLSHPGADNYGYYSGYTPVDTKCPSAVQIPCKVYYFIGSNDYYPGIKSDYSTLNCPLDDETSALLLSIGMIGYFTVRRRLF
ncbi:hypothetical protein [uncultured Pedobacter sp.]|uniref:hypothetical protein n=1 Tax=uncultured Pedobacter sp. TaxID=246139 RepID=UPI0025D85107|nr:hypothetical protein [uncultured Pedobacter sp.]